MYILHINIFLYKSALFVHIVGKTTNGWSFFVCRMWNWRNPQGVGNLVSSKLHRLPTRMVYRYICFPRISVGQIKFLCGTNFAVRSEYFHTIHFSFNLCFYYCSKSSARNAREMSRQIVPVTIWIFGFEYQQHCCRIFVQILLLQQLYLDKWRL